MSSEAAAAPQGYAGPGMAPVLRHKDSKYKRHKGRFLGYNRFSRSFELSFLMAYFVWKNPNQNFKVLITGGTGRGKSDLALFLAVNVACWMSYFIHKTPVYWKKYFNYDGAWELEEDIVKYEYYARVIQRAIQKEQDPRKQKEYQEKLDRCERLVKKLHHKNDALIRRQQDSMESKNLIVINKKKMLNVVDADESVLPQYSVLVLDEVQEIANAIDYKDLETRLFNRLNQVMRDNGYLIFAAIQEQGTHTKQSRNLYHIVIDMGELDGFEVQINFSKAFQIQLKGMMNSASKSQWRKYFREHGKKYTLGANMFAPPSVRNYYFRLRKHEKVEANKRSRQDIEKEQKMRDAQYARTVGESRTERAKQILIEHPDWKNGKIAEEAGLHDVSYISKLRRELKLPARSSGKVDGEE